MSVHLRREIESVKRQLLSLSAIVEEALWSAVRAVQERDPDIAQDVLDGDDAIDQREVAVEEECLKILALHQPVAIDLRFLITALKINNDLERIGDLAANIAARARYLATQDPVDLPFDFTTMATKTQTMLRTALDALVNVDPVKAQDVCAMDDAVDTIYREMYGLVQQGIRAHPERVGVYIHLLSISRHLERIADHATNIAEDVIYMYEGKIVRHKVDDYLRDDS